MSGKHDQVQRGHRAGSHGKRVTQCIGRRNLAEHVRIVHQGREEVDRLHDVQVIAQPIHTRITKRIGTDNQIRIGELRQAAHDLRGFPLREFACSPAQLA